MAVPLAMSSGTNALALEAKSLTFEYPSTRGLSLKVLGGISFRLAVGEIIAVVGPSGGGKTTLVKLLAGILDPTSGEVLIGGLRAGVWPGACGYVPQGYSLFPWLTVRENVVYGLRLRSRVINADSIASLLTATGLKDFSGYYPSKLSGGMQQRVALARALAIQPAVLLLDEPFSALDLKTRQEVRDYVLKGIEGTRTAAIIVTHDLPDAAYTADRILFLSPRPSVIISELKVPFGRPRRPELSNAREFFEFCGLAMQTATSVDR